MDLAKTLAEWARNRDREQPLTSADSLAVMNVEGASGSLVMISVNAADVADLRSRLLGAA